MSRNSGRFSRVLITRPQADGERLASMLAAMGIESIVQPAQEFAVRKLSASELDSLGALEPPILLVFTSPRSVEFGLPQLPPSLLAAARIAAIGPATSRALSAAGKRVDIQPQGGYTSEALLASLAGQFAEQRGHGLVVGAPGGREVLLDALAERGWKVRALWVYERQAAEIRPETLKALDSGHKLLTVFTSGEAMNSLSQRLPPSAWYAICRGEWLVISERLQRLARAFGPSRIHLASGPQNPDLATAIRSIRAC